MAAIVEVAVLLVDCLPVFAVFAAAADDDDDVALGILYPARSQLVQIK